jgi:guanylate kinase
MVEQLALQLDDRCWHEFVTRHWLVFLDGASGSGKSTFKNLLLGDNDFNFSYAKRYTTRSPRVDDAKNEDYVFISMDEFLARQENGDLIEYRHFLFGMSYGIGRTTLFEAGKQSRSILAVMNLGGVSRVKKFIPNAVCVLINARIEDIEQRLRERGLNSEEQIKERLANAQEVERISKEYDFVFENKQWDLDGSYRTLKSYLLSRRPW